VLPELQQVVPGWVGMRWVWDRSRTSLYRILSRALVKYLKGRQLDPPRRLQSARQTLNGWGCEKIRSATSRFWVERKSTPHPYL
jgi:hypothetical protein